MQIEIKRSTRKDKKFMAIIPTTDGKKKTIHFGQKGASDYTTIHKDPERKARYIKRHRKRETKFWSHTKKNLFTPSYWARYFLWEKPTLKEAKKFIEDKQNINVK